MNILTFYSQKIESISVFKALLATAFFALMIYLIDFSPIGVYALEKLTSGGKILDFEHGYSVEKAYSILANLGEEGRNFYLTKILPCDIFFPLSFMLFNFCWMSLLLKKLSKSGSAFRLLCILPVLNMISDWSENIGFFLMLKNFPRQLSTVCKISSAVTHIKFTLVLLIIISFLVLAAALFAKKMIQLKRKK